MKAMLKYNQEKMIIAAADTAYCKHSILTVGSDF